MFLIKDADKTDIPLIRELTFQVWPQTYAHLLTREQIDYMLELMYSESSLAKQMNEGCRFIIIYDEKRPVGFASYQEIGPGTWKLHKIYVLRDQQGKGSGKFIIDHIVSIIKEKDAQRLQLQVNRQNTAKQFYEKLGFKVIEDIDLDIGGGFFMKDHVMELEVG